jgi:glycosyltransferase involved in cell wall biosynthesis
MHKQRVFLLVLWFLDPDGSGKELTGGMERYCRDLALMYARDGYPVTIIQKGNVDFETDYSAGVSVVGIKSKLSFGGHFAYFRKIKEIVPTTAPVIFVSQDLCLGAHFDRAVAVNHGIWWHGDFNFVKKIVIRIHQWKMLDWLKGVVCVDTNYINWLHTEFSNRAAWRHKLTYICNYADTEIFVPVTSMKSASKSSVTIVFPRRMMGAKIGDEPRGGLMFLEALVLLKARRPDARFNVKMVGRGSLTEDLKRWCAAHGLAEEVEFFEAKFDEMPAVYQSADIVVIPSTGTEGTSLSAVESICSGATTVVTHIGGLANIVIDGLNGYVSSLTADSLSRSIERAIDEPLDGISSASALSKSRWEAQVRRCFDEKLGLS